LQSGEDGFSLAPEDACDYVARMAMNGREAGADSLEEVAKLALPGIGPWAGHPERFCANCSTELEDNRCKLSCPGCGYYLSCSDFY
jgi:hypothetical protein